MKIGNILQAFKIQAATKQKAKTDATSSSSSPRDMVNISPQAKSLQQLQADIKVAKEALKYIPNVREGKIQEIAIRLQSGYYNSAEFRAALADRLGGMLSREITAPSDEQTGEIFAKPASSAVPGAADQSRLDEIRQRISSNYYNDSSVKDSIAEKIMKNLGL